MSTASRRLKCKKVSKQIVKYQNESMPLHQPSLWSVWYDLCSSLTPCNDAIRHSNSKNQSPEDHMTLSATFVFMLMHHDTVNGLFHLIFYLGHRHLIALIFFLKVHLINKWRMFNKLRCVHLYIYQIGFIWCLNKPASGCSNYYKSVLILNIV